MILIAIDSLALKVWMVNNNFWYIHSKLFPWGLFVSEGKNEGNPFEWLISSVVDYSSKPLVGHDRKD